jgi:hypothetical protein
VLPVTPLTNKVGSTQPDLSNGTLASRIAVEKQPGWPTCGVFAAARCSGTAQVNCAMRCGAPCGCLYTAS